MVEVCSSNSLGDMAKNSARPGSRERFSRHLGPIWTRKARNIKKCKMVTDINFEFATFWKKIVRCRSNSFRDMTKTSSLKIRWKEFP